MAILVGSQETVAPRAMWTMEAQLKWYQSGAVLGTGLEAILVIFWQRKNVSALCPCPKNLPEAKLKKNWTNFLVRRDLKTAR